MIRVLVLIAALAPLAAVAGEWSTMERNRLIDQTNFVVDERCSGTLISVPQRLILTNQHCVRHRIRVEERQEVQDDGTVTEVMREVRSDVPVAQHRYSGFSKVGTAEYLTDIIAADKRWDLAVLQFKAESIPYNTASPLLPEDQRVQRSETVWAVGNPTMLDASVTRGVISSVTRTFQFPWTDGNETPMLQFDASIMGGSSGGALYNDRGHLVGVTSAGKGNAYLAIPVTTVRSFLEDNDVTLRSKDAP